MLLLKRQELQPSCWPMNDARPGITGRRRYEKETGETAKNFFVVLSNIFSWTSVHVRVCVCVCVRRLLYQKEIEEGESIYGARHTAHEGNGWARFIAKFGRFCALPSVCRFLTDEKVTVRTETSTIPERRTVKKGKVVKLPKSRHMEQRITTTTCPCQYYTVHTQNPFRSLFLGPFLLTGRPFVLIWPFLAAFVFRSFHRVHYAYVKRLTRRAGVVCSVSRLHCAPN